MSPLLTRIREAPPQGVDDDRVAECFTTLAEDARSGDWTRIEYLARLVAE